MRIKQNFIYALVDYFTNEIRYIGKTEQGKHRPREHLKPSSLRAKTHKNNWLNLHLAKGKEPEVFIIETLEDNIYLNDAEIFYIKYYRDIGCPLTNATNGGEGTSGWNPSPETRAKIGKSRLGKSSVIVNKKEHKFFNNIEMRECSKCLEYRSVNLFNWVNSRNSYYPYCKICKKSISRIQKNKNKKLLNSEELKESYNKRSQKSKQTLKKYFKDNQLAKDNLSKKRSKSIKGINIRTSEIIKFKSAIDANNYGFNNTNIGIAISKQTPYRGYIWSFDES